MKSDAEILQLINCVVKTKFLQVLGKKCHCDSFLVVTVPQFMSTQNIEYKDSNTSMNDRVANDETSWQKIAVEIPSNCANAFKMDEDTFCIMSTNPDFNAMSFHRFKINGSPIIEHILSSNPIDLSQPEYNVSCDSERNQLYIAYDSYLQKMDMETGFILTLNEKMEDHIAGLLLIGGDLHVICDDIFGPVMSHYILNEHTGYRINDKAPDSEHFIDGVVINYVLYSKSRDSIILCGRNTKDIVFEFSLSAHKWKTLNSCLSGNLVLDETAMIVSKDGRYLILFGAWEPGALDPEHNGKMDAIIVYDFKVKCSKPKLSTIRCPVEDERFRAVMLADDTYDEMLTFAFIRELYRCSEMNGVQVLPHYLIQMMAKWVETEWIYLLTKCGKGPWKINVDNILKSVQ